MKTILQHIISWVFLLIGFHIVHAQNATEQKIEDYFARIESLVDEEIDNPKIFLNSEHLFKVKLEAEGIERVNVCLELYTYFIYRSIEKAAHHNDEALDLASDLGYTEGTLRASYNKAYIEFIKGEFDKSLHLIQATISNNDLTIFSDINADFQTLKSYIHTERGEYDTALEIGMNLVKKGESSNKDYVLMRAYMSISHFYLRLGEIEKALDYCFKGFDISLNLKKVKYLFPKIDEIARMMHQLEGSERALEIYQFYLKLEKRISGPGVLIQSAVYMNIAEIYIHEKKFKESENFLQKALEVVNLEGYRFRKPRVFEVMARLHLEMKDTLKAIEYYESSLNAAIEINAFDVVKNTSGTLSELYKLKGASEIAQTFLNLHTKISDSIFSTETNQRVEIMDAHLKISEMSRQKELLELKNRAQEERYRFIFLVLVLALFSAGIAGYSYFKVKKKNKLLFNRSKELVYARLQDLEKKDEESDQVELLASPDKKNQKQNHIHNDVKEIILTKLKRFEAEKFYLNPNCNLNQLSEELQTNQKYLSHVINQEKKSNFNNYINDLRINHLLQRLIEDKEFRNSKLSYLGVVSGFNNLNTFNTAFKKRLGILPSYFIKKMNDEEKIQI